MSVPIAVVGCVLKIRISSGVISDPPPMPVMPTSTPMPNPKRTIAGSIWWSARLGLIDFPDLLGQEHAVRQDTKMVETRGLQHTYGDLESISCLDVEIPEHGVLGVVGPSGCGKSTLLELV